jgi:HlyD family secretion protein
MNRIGALIALIAAVAVGFLVLGRSKTAAEGPPQGGVTSAAAPAGAGAPKPQAVPVLAAEAMTRRMEQVLEVNGQLKTDGEVQVAHRITGKVMGVFVKEGDRVKRGQPIVRVAIRELPGEMARAQGTLQAARAKVKLLQSQAVWKDESSRSEYARAQANLAAARSRQQQAETGAQLVEAETAAAVRTAQANLGAAKERLAIARDTTRKQDLRQAQLVVEQATAQMGQARVDMENARQVFERRQTLFKQDAIAREEVDEAERRFKATQANLKVAEAGVSVAQQRLELAREGSRPEEVRVAEEQVRVAEQALAQAQSDERRRQVAKDEVEATKAAVRQAEATLKASEAGLIQTKMSLAEIEQARAEVAEAEADVEILRTRQEDLIVRAPLDGVITERQVNVGEFMQPQVPLMTLVALDSVYLEAQVPELEVALLRPGMPARVTVDSIPGRTFPATVREIIPVADRTSRAFRVRVAVLNGRGQLPANAFARARVNVGARASALVINKDAIQTEAGDRYVWLIDGPVGSQTAKRQPVQVGLVDERYAEITEGLKPGQQVVAAGSPAIIEGTPVAVAAGGAAAGGPSP